MLEELAYLLEHVHVALRVWAQLVAFLQQMLLSGAEPEYCSGALMQKTNPFRTHSPQLAVEL